MEFDGEAFGAEIVTAVKSYVGEQLVPVMVQIEWLAKEMKSEKDDPCAPPELVDEIAKAVALLAESPVLHPANQTNNPVVVNFSPANMVRKSKTITTRRDEAGNLVAKVVED